MPLTTTDNVEGKSPKPPVSHDLQRAALGLADLVVKIYRAGPEDPEPAPTHSELLLAIEYYEWALRGEGSTEKWQQ